MTTPTTIPHTKIWVEYTRHREGLGDYPKFNEFIMEKLLVAGFGMYADGTVYVILKDKVSRNANLRLVKATKTGTVAMADGITLERAHETFPLGTDLSNELQWGAAVENVDYGGVYKVEEREIKQAAA